MGTLSRVVSMCAMVVVSAGRQVPLLYVVNGEGKL